MLYKTVSVFSLLQHAPCSALWVRHTCYRLTDVRARAGNASRRPWLLRLIEMDWNGLNLDWPLTNFRKSSSYPSHATQTGIVKLGITWIGIGDYEWVTWHMWCHKLTFVALTLCIENWWEFPLGLPRSTGATTPSVAIRSSSLAARWAFSKPPTLHLSLQYSIPQTRHD